MRVVSIIGNCYQTFVKTSLICSTLVATNQKDGLSIGVESKGYTPHLAIPVKPQFLHVAMPGRLKSVDSGSPQVWTKLRQQAGVCQHFILQVLRQGAKLVIKVVVKDYSSVHCQIMYLKTYGFKTICLAISLPYAYRSDEPASV